MLSLSEIQDKFQRHLLQGDTDILTHIVSDQDISHIQRLATYKHAYTARLIEALSIDFSSVMAVLGEETFSRICLDYINQHPSTYASLRWFGSEFPDFIKQHSDFREQPYLYELAVMDWMFINAFDAADHNSLTPSCMIDVPVTSWPDIRLLFHPSVFYFTYRWNIIEIWHAIKDANKIPSPLLIDKPAVCLIWRQALSTQFRVLDEDEAAIFDDAVRGATFESLCEKLSLLTEHRDSEPESIAMRSAALLKTWLEEGLITQLDCQP